MEFQEALGAFHRVSGAFQRCANGFKERPVGFKESVPLGYRGNPGFFNGFQDCSKHFKGFPEPSMRFHHGCFRVFQRVIGGYRSVSVA